MRKKKGGEKRFYWAGSVDSVVSVVALSVGGVSVVGFSAVVFLRCWVLCAVAGSLC